MGRVLVSYRGYPGHPDPEGARRHQYTVRRAETYVFVTMLSMGAVGMWVLFAWLHDPRTPRWTWIPWTVISVALLTVAYRIWVSWRRYRIECVARDLGA